MATTCFRDVRTSQSPVSESLLKKFFVATDELDNKKLEVFGWKGPNIAMKAIKASAKIFSKDGE